MYKRQPAAGPAATATAAAAGSIPYSSLRIVASSLTCLLYTSIIEIIKYLIELINSKADVDDIDHLSNRRVRTVGEQ